MKSGGLLFLVLFFYFTGNPFASGQEHPGPIRHFFSLSRYEKKWVLFHPFISNKAHRLTRLARQTADSLLSANVLDRSRNGGQLDAFRHAYWMALLAQQIKPRKALKLGEAHEKANRLGYRKGKSEDGMLPDSASSAMDLFNNEAGISIGIQNKKLSPSQLKHLVLASVKKGELKILKKDSAGNFLDCSGNRIDMERWKGEWAIPKCLVKSDE